MPSRTLEYAFYLTVAYAVIGPALGLEIPLLAGGMLLVLAGLCILQLQLSAKAILTNGPMGLLFAFAASVFFLQIFIHGESIMDGNVRTFISWVLGLIIVRSLCLRPGFSMRLPLVLFVIGAATVPFVSFSTASYPGGVEMARVDLEVGGSLTHPNGLAEWFGFCAVFFAIFGLETNRVAFRIGAWLLAVGCLLIVSLTVERAPLFGAAIAITFSFRKLLRRGFIPVLLLILLAGVTYESGLFKQTFSEYAERGMEETGREKLWPEAIERIFASPLIGVGESKVLLSVGTKDLPPHNAFLHFALSSGILPFALLVAFWIQAVKASFSHSEGLREGPYRIPFLLFTLVSSMLVDLGFVSVWGILALSVGAGTASAHRTNRLHVLRRIRRCQTVQPLAGGSGTTNNIKRYRL